MPILRLLIGLVIMLSVFGATNYYIFRRIYQSIIFIFPNINIKMYIVISLFAVLALILGFMRSLLPFPLGIRNILGRISAYGMGIFVYLFLLFLIADFVILIGYIVNIIPHPIHKSIRFYAGTLVLAMTISLIGYGLYNVNRIKQVSYDISLSDSKLTDEIKIVLISDLHLGAINSEKRLPKVIQGINDLQPDLVCIAGDIFDNDFYGLDNPAEAVDLLKGIKAKYGVYASLGNHDAGKTFNEMVRFLEQSNIRLLKDEYEIIDDRLILIGRVDPSPIGGFGELKRKDIGDILASINNNLPIVVMDHNPSNIEQYGSEIDLVLSGHTHRGQLFPFSLVTRAMYTIDYGHYQKDVDSPHIIVTSGVSIWGPPMRIGTNNEIVSITLH